MKTSCISQHPIPLGEEVKGSDIREGIFRLIQSNYPAFDQNKFISIGELNQLRRQYLSYLIEKERGELVALDKEVMEAIKNNSVLSENFEEEKDDATTLGE